MKGSDAPIVEVKDQFAVGMQLLLQFKLPKISYIYGPFLFGSISKCPCLISSFWGRPTEKSRIFLALRRPLHNFCGTSHLRKSTIWHICSSGYDGHVQSAERDSGDISCTAASHNMPQ